MRATVWAPSIALSLAQCIIVSEGDTRSTAKVRLSNR